MGWLFLSDGSVDEVDLNTAQTTGLRASVCAPRLSRQSPVRPPNGPARRIKGVVRIGRHAVVADRVAVASLVDRPDALVAIAAERAQRAEHKLVVIAAMPWVVIGDGGRRDAALLLAQGAQRLDLQLVLGASSPGLEIIPGTPRKRLGGSEITRGHDLTNRNILIDACPRALLMSRVREAASSLRFEASHNARDQPLGRQSLGCR